jgi:hypothetical protein
MEHSFKEDRENLKIASHAHHNSFPHSICLSGEGFNKANDVNLRRYVQLVKAIGQADNSAVFLILQADSSSRLQRLCGCWLVEQKML